MMAIAGEGKGKKKGDKAILDAVWGMGLKMNREVKGMRAGNTAL